MWIRGLADIYFSASTGSGPWRLHHFDTDTASFAHVTGENGEDFTPGYPSLSPSVSAFGHTLLGGQILEAPHLGSEVYSLNPDGTVSLFADLTPGEGGSFISFDRGLNDFSESDYVVATMVVPRAFIPVAIYDDGSSEPFANFFENLDRMTNATFIGFHDDRHIFSTRINGRLEFDLIGVDVALGRYWTYRDTDQLISNLNIKRSFLLDDRLFAAIDTPEFGAELWEWTGERWELYEDYAAGQHSPFPGYRFSFNGNHFFSAANAQRELGFLRMDAEGFTPIAGPETIFNLSTFEWDGALYMRTGHSAFEFHRIDAAGNVSQIDGFSAGEMLPWPDVLINLDTLTLQKGNDWQNITTAYAIRDGEIYQLDLPEGTVDVRGFFGGTLYVVTEDPATQRHLYALNTSGEWVKVFEASLEQGDPYTPSLTSVFHADLADISNVWLGDDSAEVITPLEDGGIIYARGGTDTIQGGAGVEHVYAGDGNDVVRGGAGMDLLLGEAGHDSLVGDAGADTLDGGSGHDTLNGIGGNDDLLGRGGDDRMSGGGGDDSMFGGHGNDALWGGRGDDKLLGGHGNDFIRGGFDNDTLRGASGNDRLQGGSGRDQLFGDDGADLLVGHQGDDVLFGGDGNDDLRGKDGQDALNGGAGADRLQGDTGNDTLTGDSGRDTFIFRANSGVDVITDFEEGFDRIVLRGLSDHGLTGFDNLNVSQVGADTEIVLYAENLIILRDTDADVLGASDFIF